MHQTIHIATKEFKDYFISPIAYIVISLFLVITGWFFFSTFFIFDRADMRNFFALLPTIFSFIIPAVTMRLFSEEVNVGSYETLMTLPVSFRDIALGKFLAATAFCGCMLLPTLSYPLFISMIGEVDPGPVMGGYLGALLLAGAYCALGILASSMTRNQIVAFILGAAICFALTILDRVLFFIPPSLTELIGFLGTNTHFQSIAKGVIDSRDILYFLSVMFLGLFGTYLVMQEKN
ncbi:ABC-2 type transport system permease protein [Desulfocicer vacuolatum DSM 3385]|uniref:ABC-2 type transport system permease protein n=1 Tax=Desulfocicer vacuolatum DSM 3385 TaxID=1121400 RepID=A0A1W1YH26_9BACT|nr:ABC transporter permease subunit [Desulfocicer vacuolatum]SMC35459.1 ABC-2 type transport system permease protein [Desulfocicer vacuolatum DSM 3385]